MRVVVELVQLILDRGCLPRARYSLNLKKRGGGMRTGKELFYFKIYRAGKKKKKIQIKKKKNNISSL